VGGWENISPGEKDERLRKTKPFLNDLVSSYPSLCFDGPNDLVNFYTAVGQYQISDGQKNSLASALQGHNLNQAIVADADRYGLLTQVMRQRVSETLENENFQYIKFPPADTLKDVPTGSLPEITSATIELLKQSRGNVVFTAFSNIWSISRYNDVKLTKTVKDAAEKKIIDVVRRAIDAKIRVLIISDSGLLSNHNLDSERGANILLPCILVDKKLEGLKAGTGDIGSNEILPVISSGSVNDIAPTILALMGISLSNGNGQHLLFKNCIKHTL